MIVRKFASDGVKSKHQYIADLLVDITTPRVNGMSDLQYIGARGFITENLERLKKRNFFNAAVIDEWWYHQDYEYDWVKIWQLVTFELWYQKYFEE